MGSRSDLFIAFKETRVSPEPIFPAAAVHARVPNGNGGRRITGDTRGGARGGAPFGGNGGANGSIDGSDDERSYRFKTLASEAGIFHRKHHDAPRSFLWRVLEGRTVLSLRAVDIAKTSTGTAGTGFGSRSRSGSVAGAGSDLAAALDAPLTLYLHFPKPIRPGCVAFADPPQHDALTVLALDEASHLHHLQLRPEVFRKRASPAAGNEADLGEAWKPYLSATFNFKQPRRVVAVSANEFVVTLNDGGLINFRRDHAHEASWKETFHSPVGLIQGLRSILPFQGSATIKYEGTHLDATAATAAAVSSLGLDDVTFLFSVCLDHRLRIWNLERGDVCYTGDILGLVRDPHEQVGKWSIDPGQSNLLRIADLSEGVSVLVTYSPVGAGAFKFWKASATPDGGVEVEPLDDAAGAGTQLQPPPPSASDVWTLADFAVAAHPARGKLSLWVLWKNNLVYRVMTLECAPDQLASAWRDGWLGVHAESSGSAPTAQTSGPCDPTDAAEKWLDLIFFPGRFSKATLETALTMYERGLGASLPETTAASRRGLLRSSSDNNSGSNGTNVASGGGRSLMEAVCSVLGSTAALEQGPAGTMDYDLFRSASEIQWRRFYRLLIELDKQRAEALSLVLDPELGLTWVVCTDGLAAIRECSALERLYHNVSSSSSGGIVGGGGGANYDKVARLLAAGTAFLDSFSDGMLQTCEAALRSEVFDDSNYDDSGLLSSSRSDEERMQLFSDRAGFWRHLTEDECAQVADILGGDFFDDVDAAAYDTLLDLLEDVQQQQQQQQQHRRHSDVRYPFTQFGQKLVLSGLQDTAELVWQILFRQLILLVHMEFEIEDVQRVLHARLDVGRVYSRLVGSLRRLALVRWLGRHEFSVALSRSERESLSLPGSFSGASFAAGGGASGSFGSSSNGSSGDENPTQVVTALEASVGHLLGLSEPVGAAAAGGLPFASLLTDMLVDVCSARGSIELEPAMIQCMLLKRERPDLAYQLGPFASSDPFSTYVQGRTFLALRDYDTASTYFRRAAVGLSTVLRNPLRHSAGLIDDAEWNLFYSGLPNYYAHIVALYDRQKAYSFVIDFSRLALQFVRGEASKLGLSNGSSSSSSGDEAGERPGAAGSRKASRDEQQAGMAEAALTATRTEMLSRMFTAAAALSRFDTAHTALVSMGQPLPGQSTPPATAVALQRSCLRFLVEKMCETGQVATLLALALPPNLRDAVDDVLEQKCRTAADVVRSTPAPWHQILYTWRIAHNDYRGAASVLMDRLQKLQRAGEGNKFAPALDADGAGGGAGDSLDTPVTRQYLLLINTLSCVEPKQAWIYTEDETASGRDRGLEAKGGHGEAAQPNGAPASGGASAGASAMVTFLQKAAAAQRPAWRKVVTLADLRKQYQAELDRIAAIQNNQFAFGATADDEDVTMGDL